MDWCYCVQLLKILSLALMWQRDFWAGLASKFPLQEKHARKYQCASFASNSGFTTGNKSYVFSFTKAPYSACFLWKTPPQYPNQKKAHQGIFHFFAHSWGFPPLIHSQGSDCQCRIPQVTSGHNRTFGPTSHFHYAIMPCCARSLTAYWRGGIRSPSMLLERFGFTKWNSSCSFVTIKWFLQTCKCKCCEWDTQRVIKT